MMRKCHLNTCPVGIATQDPVLRAKFTGRPEHSINYFFFVADEVREHHGATRRPHARRAGWARGSSATARIDESTGSARPRSRAAACTDARRCVRRIAADGCESRIVRDELDGAADRARAAGARRGGARVRADLPIRNVGSRGGRGDRWRNRAPPRQRWSSRRERSFMRFSGSAGQSFGAFATRGLTLELEGEANDYVGKGLSGGRIVDSCAAEHARFCPDGTRDRRQHGALRRDVGRGVSRGRGGRALRRAQQRRDAVVEGVGDHGCEYMTGGIVVVLGARVATSPPE